MNKFKFSDCSNLFKYNATLSIRHDNQHFDNYLNLDCYLPSTILDGVHPNLKKINNRMSFLSYELPELLNFNMELCGFGNIKDDNGSSFVEYLFFFKPYILTETGLPFDLYPSLESFTYVMPYRIFPSFIATSIVVNRFFSLNDLKSVRVFNNFNLSFFDEVQAHIKNRPPQIVLMGSAIAGEMYKKGYSLEIDEDYNDFF